MRQIYASDGSGTFRKYQSRPEARTLAKQELLSIEREFTLSSILNDFFVGPSLSSVSRRCVTFSRR
jgi:hypothetical protein